MNELICNCKAEHWQLHAKDCPRAAQRTKMTPTTPSPISHERAFHIALVLEMSELSDRNSPEDDPSAMVADSNEMAGCIERALERADLVLAPPVSEPVAWWNGFRKDDDERDGLSGPAFSSVETTWHDIPLYAGVNPCNLSTAPTTGSAPSALGEMVGWCYEHGGRTRFVNRGDTYSDSIVFKMQPVYYATPASPAAGVHEAEWITKVKRELMMSKMTHNFTFSRDQVIEMLGGQFSLLAASMGGDKS